MLHAHKLPFAWYLSPCLMDVPIWHAERDYTANAARILRLSATRLALKVPDIWDDRCPKEDGVLLANESSARCGGDCGAWRPYAAAAASSLLWGLFRGMQDNA